MSQPVYPDNVYDVYAGSVGVCISYRIRILEMDHQAMVTQILLAVAVLLAGTFSQYASL